MKYGFIGFGNLAQAIYQQLKTNNQLEFAYTSKTNQHPQPQNFKSIAELIQFSDIIILGIKPQQLSEISSQLQNCPKPIISLLAAKSIQDLNNDLGQNTQIIRMMPNLAVKFGKSVTAYNHNLEDSSPLLKQILKDFTPTGEMVLLPEESFAKFTSLFGSGPGILFYLYQAFATEIKELNLSTELLNNLLQGSHLILEENPNLAENIQKVASKGGITEAIINNLESQKILNQLKESFKIGEQKGQKL